MTVKELIEALSLKAFYVEEEDREIEGVYCGDLLSWVMGKCPADAAWITIMSNQNVAAVAVLCDTACIILSENVQPDAELLERAEIGLVVYTGALHDDTIADFPELQSQALRRGKPPPASPGTPPAGPEARPTRRWKEYQAKGMPNTYEEVLADVKQRDYQDTHRAAAPLKQAEDAVLLDTSELNFEQSLDAMKQIIAQKVG